MRNDAESEYGSSFIMENMAFKSTESSTHSEMVKFTRSVFLISRRLEDIGATVIKRSGRDCISFICETLRDNVEECVKLLSETITQPRLLDEEIQDASVGLSDRWAVERAWLQQRKPHSGPRLSQLVDRRTCLSATDV